MIPRRRWRRFAWLGLFAMVMAFVAPVVSQVLAVNKSHASAMSPVMVSVSSSTHGHDHHAMVPGQGAASSLQAHWAAVWEKCGYCDLLFSNPPLSSSITLPFALPLPLGEPFVVLTHPGYAASTVYLGALTRAPPVLG